MDRVRKIINAGRAYEKGYYGEEIGVAVLDTGERVIILSSSALDGRTVSARTRQGLTIIKVLPFV